MELLVAGTVASAGIGTHGEGCRADVPEVVGVGDVAYGVEVVADILESPKRVVALECWSHGDIASSGTRVDAVVGDVLLCFGVSDGEQSGSFLVDDPVTMLRGGGLVVVIERGVGDASRLSVDDTSVGKLPADDVVLLCC